MKFSHLSAALFAVVIGYTIFAAEPAMAETVSVAAVAGYAVGDAALRKSKALPNGAASITSDAIDLGQGPGAANVADYEIYLEAPALNATQLPNTQTMTYDLVTSANADMSSPTVVQAGALVQTGAGGVGAAAAEIGLRLPLEAERYVGVKATNSGAGNASASLAAIALRF